MVRQMPGGPMDLERLKRQQGRRQLRGFARVPPAPGVAMGRTGRPPEATPKLPMPSLPPWMQSPGRPMEPAAGVIDRQPSFDAAKIGGQMGDAMARGGIAGRPMQRFDSPPPPQPETGGEFAPAPGGPPTDREFMNPRDQFTNPLPGPEKLPMPALPPGMSSNFAPASAPLGQDKYRGRPRQIMGIKRPDEDPDRQLY